MFRTKSVGNGAISVRQDGRVCAVGGWDGKIRLFSTKSGKPLGTLRYHKTACQSLTFGNQFPDSAVEDDDLDRDKKLETRFWLLGGGKDGRISVWNLVGLGKSS